jgi:hypothetical protein
LPADTESETKVPNYAPIDGIDGLLAPARVVLLVELHGSMEIPAFLGEMVCHALAAKREAITATIVLITFYDLTKSTCGIIMFSELTYLNLTKL